MAFHVPYEAKIKFDAIESNWLKLIYIFWQNRSWFLHFSTWQRKTLLAWSTFELQSRNHIFISRSNDAPLGSAHQRNLDLNTCLCFHFKSIELNWIDCTLCEWRADAVIPSNQIFNYYNLTVCFIHLGLFQFHVLFIWADSIRLSMRQQNQKTRLTVNKKTHVCQYSGFAQNLWLDRRCNLFNL